MISALRVEGDGSKADDSTDRLCEWNSDKGRGSRSSKFLRTSYVNGRYGCRGAVEKITSLFSSTYTAVGVRSVRDGSGGVWVRRSYKQHTSTSFNSEPKSYL